MAGLLLLRVDSFVSHCFSANSLRCDGAKEEIIFFIGLFVVNKFASCTANEDVASLLISPLVLSKIENHTLSIITEH